jgi:hypothetical protein
MGNRADIAKKEDTILKGELTGKQLVIHQMGNMK